VGSLAVGRLADLDAVTLDLYGTLVTLRDPVPKLVETLRAQGIERAPEDVGAAVKAELAYYGAHSHEGLDPESIDDLNERCAQVFLDPLDTELSPREFAPHYVAALEFELLPHALDSVRALRNRGLDLAALTNWDVTIHDRLDGLGLKPYFSHVVTAAEFGARKPDPRLFEHALDLLGVPPERALHVGDDEADRHGAEAVGMQFAFPPLERVLEELA
jgi:HAD superfamily hydrolase (TIGR01509 family)